MTAVSRVNACPKKGIFRAGRALTAAVLALAVIGLSCKKNSTGPSEPDREYTVVIENRDIFTDANIYGTVFLEAGGKTQSGSNTPTFKINTNHITSINLNVPGYISAYIMTKDDAGHVMFTKDANGNHTKYDLSNTTTRLRNYLIPADFDTVLFAQCIGNNTSGDAGDGTVQRYDHSDKTVKVGALAYPDKPTATTLDFDRRAAQRINDAADGTLYLNFIGEVSGEIMDGCTHAVDNNHVIITGVNRSSNAFQKSNYYTPNVDTGVSLQTIVEEMMNASTGIHYDAGGAGSPYIAEGGVIIPEGRRAIRLVNLIPLGFKFSTTGVPAVNVQYLKEVVKTQEQQEAEAEALAGNVSGHPGARYPSDKRAGKDFREKRIRDYNQQ